MTFGEAIEILRSRGRVKRAGWKEGESAIAFPALDDQLVLYKREQNGRPDFADGWSTNRWESVTNEDLFAEDWSEYK